MNQAYIRYTTTCNAGRELLKKHTLLEEGTWEVLGEDPNCDFAGPHHQPTLGLFTGNLQEVLLLAVDLPGFWTWGGGGNVKKQIIRTVAQAKGQKQIRDEIAALKKRIEDLEKKLAR